MGALSRFATVFLGGLEHITYIFPFFPAPPFLPCTSDSHLWNEDGKTSSHPSSGLIIHMVSSPQLTLSLQCYSTKINEVDLGCELKGWNNACNINVQKLEFTVGLRDGIFGFWRSYPYIRETYQIDCLYTLGNSNFKPYSGPRISDLTSEVLNTQQWIW